MQVSLIIPTLRVGNLVDECIKSFEGQYDELIVIDSKEKSLAEKQNLGMKQSKGDYLIVSNDDVTANSGSLRDLCVPDTVVSPTIKNGTLKKFHAHLFCMPRKIYEEVGGFDESCPGVYHIDSDLWIRLIDAGYPPIISDKVSINHNHPSATISTLDQSSRNTTTTRQWFINKHGAHRCGEVGA